MSDFPFVFDSPLVQHDVGTYAYTVVFLPAEMTEELPFQDYPRLRIRGEVGGAPFSGAFQPVRGRWYLLLSKQFRRKAKLEVGDWVSVRFQIEDQNAVDVPDELRLALAENKYAMDTWETLSAGKRRGLAYRVATAKTAPTRQRRVASVIEMLVLGEV
ncbi:MAG: YdeI/OmpD-associated family protein [Cyanobacteria bacterium P01_A01_bin.116]